MVEGHREKLLDQALADTFPASDPVSAAQPGGGEDGGAPRPDASAQPRKPLLVHSRNEPPRS
jgi:hypothetical protein